MRTIWTAAVALLVSATEASAEGPAAHDVRRAAASAPQVRCEPLVRLSVEGGLAFLPSPDGPLGEPTGAPDSVRVDDLAYASSAAARVTLELAPSPCRRFRFRGSWLGAWEDDVAVRGEFGVRPPAAVVPRSDVLLSAKAHAWSADVEWVPSLGRRGRWSFDGRLGAGVIGFDETLEAVVGNLATVRGDAESLFALARVGASAEVALAERLSASGSAVALLGLSHRSMEAEDSGLLTPGAKRDVDRADSFAYGAEGQVRMTWRVRPRVSLFASYDLLFMTEVLRARDGLDFTRADTGAVQPRQRLDELVLHTVTLGLTVGL